MKPQVALQFESLFAVDVEQELPDEQGDFVGKFFADALLDTALGGEGHAAKLRAESSRIDERAKTIYRKIADAAATPKVSSDPKNLNKRASGKTIEETVYPSGAKVIAELENGIVVRTYIAE